MALYLAFYAENATVAEAHLNGFSAFASRGSGFKSPQLHPNQQVRAMIFGLDDHAKDHLTVARPSW
jgi:hypothetical protein